jgi:hypothetical protein
MERVGGALRAGALAGTLLMCPGSARAANDGDNTAKEEPAPKVLNTIQDVGAAFRSCWRPPPMDEARPGMQITVIVSFTRTGEILGEPRFSYLTRGATSEQRASYQQAVTDTLKRCTPLRFTEALGDALAGHPFAIRFVDDRGTKAS